MEGYKQYHVIIPGGGLAGLTLALQLKKSMPDIAILVLEKRTDNAPVAAHKVGESTSELGAHYLREVLQLKEYLTQHQLPKFGFRFFFSPEHTSTMSRRVEVGSRILNPIPTHQIDRGILENDLVHILNNLGVEVILGATVRRIEFSKEGHQIHFERKGVDYCMGARWIIDATGRRGLLKRTLGLEKKLDHDASAAWFRLGCEIDIDDWSENKTWSAKFEPGRRRLATNHLMGCGYWVWIIPLVSGNTSIGIVADPSFHPLNHYDTFEKAMNWLEKYEPVAAKMLGMHQEKLIDFKVMNHFAHDTQQFYSVDRWGVTGDAGAFLDPFYSPGTDFVGLGNSWLTELIIRDIRGEDISLRTLIYDRAHQELLRGWTLLYRNMYGLFGKTQIMLMKIVWDWASYWAIPTLMFINNGYTNIAVLKQYSATTLSIGRRFAKLNKQMQELFQAWSQYHVEPCSDHYINVFDLDCLAQFHQGLSKKYNPEELIPTVEANLKILEQIAAETFRLVCSQIRDTPQDMKVDPYAISVHDSGADLLEKSNSPNALTPVESIQIDLARVWLNPIKMSWNGNSSIVAIKMEYIQKLFLGIRDYMQSRPSLEDLMVFLEAEPPEYRSVAFESASMEIGLQDMLNGEELNGWEQFYLRAGKDHSFHLDIGLGWAFAKTKTFPDSSWAPLHPLMRWMVYDGIGYYCGFFKAKKAIKNHVVLEGIAGQDIRGYDQGIGRSLWYMTKGEVKKVNQLIQTFPSSRHPDLWRGVGIACGYVGGNKRADLEFLSTASAECKQQLCTGIALAAMSRVDSDSVTLDIEIACQVICEMTLNEIAELRRNIEDKVQQGNCHLIIQLESGFFNLKSKEKNTGIRID